MRPCCYLFFQELNFVKKLACFLKPFDSLRNIGPQQHSPNALGSVRSSSAAPMSFQWPSPLRQCSCTKSVSVFLGPYSGLAFGCHKSCLRTGFPMAFTSPHQRLYWRGLSQSQVVFWICCCGFCNSSVFSWAGLLVQCPTPKPGGPVGLVSEFSFS